MFAFYSLKTPRNPEIMFRRILIPLLLLAVLAAGIWGLVLRPEPRDVTTNSDEAYGWYVKGVEEREKFFWAEALEDFENAVEADSSFAMAWVELAMSYRNLEDKSGCDEALEHAYALRDNITEMERLYVDYYHYLLSGEYEQANVVLDEMAEKYPDDIRSVLVRAQRAWADGDEEQATKLYERALELDPSKVMSHNQLGYLYLKEGDYDTAIANLRRYAYYAEDQPNPHDSLGEAYEAAGMYEEAIQEYLKALEIRPSFYHSAYHLASPLAITGQVERARYMMAQAESAMEELGVPTTYMPVRRMRVESLGLHPENVVTIADQLIASSDPESSGYIGEMVNTYTFRTFALIELDRLEEAEASFEQVGQFWDTLQEKNKGMGQMGASQAQTGKIIGGLLTAYLQVKKGADYQAAAADVANTLDESDWPPHEMAFWRHDLAKIYFLGGEYDRAQEQLELVLASQPQFPYSNLLLAQLHAKLGRHEQALDHLAIYLNVMRFADEDHRGMQQARELYEELS
jgi:tetratricopeptide (TPR) repeat protein